VYLRLASLNEVGGDPREFGTSVQAFHALNARRLERWPGSLAATSTHDTKRSEDVRVRIDALSEVPREWRTLLARWARQNRRFRTDLEGTPAPDRNDELLLYQTLVGTYPDAPPPPRPEGADDYRGRVHGYLQKALREAKAHTSWTNVDAEYEDAVRRFTDAVLGSEEFLESFAPFARRVADAGRISSLAQLALKLASPGPCDVYQGSEVWDLSLVDPDNRRPVDFARRASLLGELEAGLAREPDRAAWAASLSDPVALRDGRAKLLLLRQGLQLRRELPALFLEGEYLPLAPQGPDAEHLVAFARRTARHALVCVVPRLVLGREGREAWEARIALPDGLAGELRDVVSGVVHEGGALEASRLFAAFPVALLAT
jgi:(1->4)-alpha-D-glucan 1-alpha-D-glucosylmutase